MEKGGDSHDSKQVIILDFSSSGIMVRQCMVAEILNLKHKSIHAYSDSNSIILNRAYSQESVCRIVAHVVGSM